MGTKSFLSSKTIWGGVVLYVVSLCESNGHHVSDLVAPLSQNVAQLIDALIQFISLVTVIAGRFTANTKLTAHGDPIVVPASPSPAAPSTGELQALGVKRSPLLPLVLVGFLSLAFSGCASDGSLTPAAQNVLTKSEAAAWTIAGAYETVNTATGGNLTTALLNKALVASHNSSDITQVDAAAKLADAAISARAAAVKAGASGPAQQAVVTTVLSDPGVIATAAGSTP